MKKFLLLAPLALLSLQPHAQTSRYKVGIVNVQTVVKSMPGSAPFLAVSQKADTDLKAQAKTLTVLQAKATARTASSTDRSVYSSALKKYQTASQTYNQQIKSALAPLAGRVDAAVASVAKASGYSVVLDTRVAQTSGLVIYANLQATDLTAAVTAKIKNGK
ncbi:OmpH family outer membrane protein [Deinococcus sp.]|uniref:OmpH family outer membrane protein n=1 Tax=Deinococcus sp. TaxID=47478 RepID=UPI003CC51FF5